MRIFRFIEKNEDFIKVPLPRSLKGKFVQITIEERAPEDGVAISLADNEQLKQKEDELILLDKLRNQLDVWDI
ncbi:MAG TPA: hypothetical protein DHW15_11140 [Bacteroidetes bacterium]|jgi:hypothetical protein|nr:MAG: hypothetical protein ABR94_00625 [Sphingobacteriales bacterium BACL12 MAG-120802-bin5]KRP11334.1 MAG: hypothetical protein ABR95_07350 [Sphingobacteriales bacterium BACL12 MAG-120813-bin55]HCK22683.1 hypothetical protein [Bacteroidota bacterium]